MIKKTTAQALLAYCMYHFKFAVNPEYHVDTTIITLHSLSWAHQLLFVFFCLLVCLLYHIMKSWLTLTVYKNMDTWWHDILACCISVLFHGITQLQQLKRHTQNHFFFCCRAGLTPANVRDHLQLCATNRSLRSSDLRVCWILSTSG